MKFTSAVVLSLASYALAVSVADLPSCALNCFTIAVSTSTCGLTDTVCQCTTGKTAITNSATPCVAKACSAADQSKTLQVSNEICAAAVSGSASASGASSTASGASSSATKSTASTAASGTSSAAATQSSSAAAARKFELAGAGAAMLAAGVFAF